MAFIHVQLWGRELYISLGKPEAEAEPEPETETPTAKAEAPQGEAIVRTNHGGSFERSGSWFGFGRHVIE